MGLFWFRHLKLDKKNLSQSNYVLKYILKFLVVSLKFFYSKILFLFAIPRFLKIYILYYDFKWTWVQFPSTPSVYIRIRGRVVEGTGLIIRFPLERHWFEPSRMQVIHFKIVFFFQ